MKIINGPYRNFIFFRHVGCAMCCVMHWVSKRKIDLRIFFLHQYPYHDFLYYTSRKPSFYKYLFRQYQLYFKFLSIMFCSELLAHLNEICRRIVSFRSVNWKGGGVVEYGVATGHKKLEWRSVSIPPFYNRRAIDLQVGIGGSGP